VPLEPTNSVDLDQYPVDAATDRLCSIGLHPHTAVCDLTQALPRQFDRIVSSVAVRPIPVSWLHALRPGRRLVTTIAGTRLVLIADKTADGGASGHIAHNGASFMAARQSPTIHQGGPRRLWDTLEDIRGRLNIWGELPVYGSQVTITPTARPPSPTADGQPPRKTLAEAAAVHRHRAGQYGQAPHSGRTWDNRPQPHLWWCRCSLMRATRCSSDVSSTKRAVPQRVRLSAMASSGLESEELRPSPFVSGPQGPRMGRCR
jgi:hypothetical protein